MDELSWLGILRHGQSAGNIAAEQAETGGADIIDISTPDAETPLTETGRDQAQAAASWLGSLTAEQRPRVLISSTYRRATETAQLLVDGMNAPMSLRYDERLRDRELGILDRLTSHGVVSRHPDEEARRRFLGKFYYRPPGGESWADVVLRLRSFLTDVRQDHPGQRVLLVSHEALVLLLRYLIENLSVAEVLELAGYRLTNAGLTSWELRDGGLALVAFDDDAPAQFAATPTRQTHV